MGPARLIKPTAAHLPNPIVGNGYAIPGEDAWVIGSSYEYRPWQPEQATQYNIDANRRFIGTADVSPLQHKRAARCVSSDRDPVIGQLRENRWISTAHGSLGTSSAPLAAAIIGSDLMGMGTAGFPAGSRLRGAKAIYRASGPTRGQNCWPRT